MAAACDFVLAEKNTRFRFSEVKLGLIPAIILPFVAKRLSVQNLRKWILTGNEFSAPEACDAGLVDVLAEPGSLVKTTNDLIKSFETESPLAVKKAKVLINQVVSGEIGVEDTNLTSEILAKAISSAEGHKGIKAFQEKRNPVWK